MVELLAEHADDFDVGVAGTAVLTYGRLGAATTSGYAGLQLSALPSDRFMRAVLPTMFGVGLEADSRGVLRERVGVLSGRAWGDGSFVRDLVVSADESVPPERIYGTLADLSTHTVWAGSMHGKENFGLRSLEPTANTAVVGTAFRSTGDDPMGSSTDR